MSRTSAPEKPTPKPPTLRDRLASPWLVGISGAVYFGSQAIIASILDPIPPIEVLKAQTTFSRDAFVALVTGWQTAGLLGHYRHHYDVDMIHPLFYAVFLASLLAYTLRRMGAEPARDRLIAIPVVACALDVVENLCHLHFLEDLDAVSAPLVAVSALAANLKWLLVVVSLGMAATFYAKGGRATHAAH